MIRALSGREHVVCTRFAITGAGGDGRALHEETVSTRVRFRALEEDEIEGYAATGEGLDKAGAYAIQGIGAFAVERIGKIEVSEQGFEVPADFDPSAYARGAFGIAGGKPEPVEIVFDAEMAGYIQERVWHESQQIEEGPNGSVVLRMSVAPGFELKSWIKGFLPHVRVVKPASLREEIARDLDASRAAFELKAAPRSSR